VTQRFGKPERHVLQRTKLAHLAPALLKAYRGGEMPLECLEAFSPLPTDQKRQAKVWWELQGWQRGNAGHIRRVLTDKSPQATTCW